MQSTGAARAAQTRWLCRPTGTPGVTYSESPGSAALSPSISQRHRLKSQPSGLLQPLFHARAAVPTGEYRPEDTEPAAGMVRAMHLLAAGRAGVVHITPQVDPVPGGHTGEEARRTQPARRLGTAGARQGPDRGRGRARGGGGRGGRGAPGAVRMFGRTSQ